MVGSKTIDMKSRGLHGSRSSVQPVLIRVHPRLTLPPAHPRTSVLSAVTRIERAEKLSGVGRACVDRQRPGAGRAATRRRRGQRNHGRPGANTSRIRRNKHPQHHAATSPTSAPCAGPLRVAQTLARSSMIPPTMYLIQSTDLIQSTHKIRLTASYGSLTMIGSL